MSPENLATIRSVYDAMNNRDMPALERLADEHPEYRWRNSSDMVEPDVREGPQSVLSYVAGLFETFGEMHTVIAEVQDLGPDAAAFVVRHWVRGAASGAEGERSEVHLWRARDGKVVGLEEFLTLEEARAAV